MFLVSCLLPVEELCYFFMPGWQYQGSFSRFISVFGVNLFPSGPNCVFFSRFSQSTDGKFTFCSVDTKNMPLLRKNSLIITLHPVNLCLRMNCSRCRLWKKSNERGSGTDGKDQNRKIHKRSCGWQMRPIQAMSPAYYSRKKSLSKQVPASGLAKVKHQYLLHVFAALNSFCCIKGNDPI